MLCLLATSATVTLVYLGYSPLKRMIIQVCYPQLVSYLPTAREGNVFTGFLFVHNRPHEHCSLLGLVTARSVCILLECFLVSMVVPCRECRVRRVLRQGAALKHLNITEWNLDDTFDLIQGFVSNVPQLLSCRSKRLCVVRSLSESPSYCTLHISLILR